MYLKTHPAVFAVDKYYQIAVAVTAPSLMWVEIKLKSGETKSFYDHSNGIMKSILPLHRVKIPMEMLDKAGAYTVCIRPLVERKPYFTETLDVFRYEYSFRPVPENDAKAYCISDAHNHIETPIKAAKAYGDFDFLILNGDVIDHSGDPSKFDNIYEITSRLLKGERPAVFSRGNHDMRGNFAESFADYTPSHNGKTYYTFRLGSIYGIILDTGEDKPDESREYGHTVCCHEFRLEETDYLNELIEKGEYNSPDIKHVVVIAHNPFTERLKPPFDIEEDIFRNWAKLLSEHVKPELFIAGHTHRPGVFMPGCEVDHYGQPCPVVVSSTVEYATGYFVGCGIRFGDPEREVVFTDSNGKRFNITKIK